jgi:hypothetical protein
MDYLLHCDTLNPQKLASATNGDRSVGTVRLRIKATEFSLVFSLCFVFTITIQQNRNYPKCCTECNGRLLLLSCNLLHKYHRLRDINIIALKWKSKTGLRASAPLHVGGPVLQVRAA